MSILIVVLGLPGSGKSFFAKKLSQQLSALYLSSDILRKELFPAHRSYSDIEKQTVYSTLLSKAEQGLQHKQTVIVDATFYKNALRLPFFKLTEDYHVPLYIFYIHAEETLIRERISVVRADSEADYSVYLRLKDQFEPIEKPFVSLSSTNDNIEQLLSSALTHIAHD